MYAERQSHRGTDTQKYMHTETGTEIQAHRKTGTRRDWHTDRHTFMHAYM